MDVGEANGWNVWPMENGDWAWSAWVASNGGRRRSGIRATELEAQESAQRAVELLASDARAAAQPRRELPVHDDREKRWEPQL